MQRAEHDVTALTQGICQLLIDPANFGLAGQKYQQAPTFIVECIQNGLHHSGFDELARHKRPPPTHRHREHAAFAAHHRGITEQTGQSFTFQRGGHQQDFQWLFITKQFAAIEAQGQR